MSCFYTFVTKHGPCSPTLSHLRYLQCAKARRDVDSLSALLGEAKAALGASKGELETTMANHMKTLDRARKVLCRTHAEKVQPLHPPLHLGLEFGVGSACVGAS